MKTKMIRKLEKVLSELTPEEFKQQWEDIEKLNIEGITAKQLIETFNNGMETKKVVICKDSLINATDWEQLYLLKGIQIHAYRAVKKHGVERIRFIGNEEDIEFFEKIPVSEVKPRDDWYIPDHTVLMVEDLGLMFEKRDDYYQFEIPPYFEWQNREDEDLITFAETRPDKFKIIEIPKDVEYDIVDADFGGEYISEKHRTWF